MSKKDYKKGMEDALAANEGFSKKQEAAINHVRGEVAATAKKVDKLGDKIGEITDYITDQEKAALYKLNTPVDIADLDSNEKRVLLAVLYQLSADEEELTENQQNYVRAVQQYLKIYNPQTEIDLEAIENIEDISAQKAILQTVLEFFYLGTHPKSYTEDQIDFLDCFQVNRKTRKEISGYVEAIIATAGIQGLAEKYGFVAQQPKSAFATYADNGAIPGAVADAIVKERPHLVSFLGEGLPFLELKDYLVFVSGAKGGSVGLFRVDKRTGQGTKLPLDYKDPDGNINVRMHLSFHVRGNVLYLMWSNVYLKNVEYVSPLEIDVEKLTYRELPIKFLGKDFSDHIPHIHLSGDAAQLVVYAYNHSYQSGPVHNRPYNGGEPYYEIYVADLTQDRVFQIAPDMQVRDAFWWDGSLLLLGCYQNTDSLYQYDIKTKAIKKFLGETSACGWWRMSDYQDHYSLCRIDRVDDCFFFLVNHNTSIKSAGIFEFYSARVDEKGVAHIEEIYHPGAFNEFFAFGDDCFYWVEMGYLRKYDFTTREETEIDGGGSYLILGDYIYKGTDGTTFKTNISQGTDNLMWEIMP